MKRKQELADDQATTTLDADDADAKVSDEAEAERDDTDGSEGVQPEDEADEQSPAEDSADGQSDGKQDDQANEGEEQSSEADDAKPKRSAAEVIAELRDSIERMQSQFNSAEKLISVCKKELVKDADEYRREGMQPLLESFMLIHDLIFRHAQAMEAGDVAPDSFVLNLLRTVEAEMKNLGISVVRPHPGDELELAVMKTIGTAKCPFWRKADRIARVHSCGFAIRMQSGPVILRKAEVTVYRKDA